MSVYDETIVTVRALAARAARTENVLFCERRPLTSLEARLAGVDDLAKGLREIEDEALRALERVVEAEQGYETALEATEAVGADATNWLRAVMLARSIETVPAP
ncbi:MAG TPA: hypothetical protein VKG38_06755 [Solirubrobacteraceae bacterium]|nr:hypothetical protein [Solirubrobacteraceae bacterium]